jgi:hypothetical protein
MWMLLPPDVLLELRTRNKPLHTGDRWQQRRLPRQQAPVPSTIAIAQTTTSAAGLTAAAACPARAAPPRLLVQTARHANPAQSAGTAYGCVSQVGWRRGEVHLLGAELSARAAAATAGWLQ